MSPKFHRNPPHRIQTECLVWAAISLLILFTVCPTAIVGQVQRGDANGDGVIDGRDALTVLRVTEGLAPGSEDVTTRGDVYPYPGIGGQMLGDGRLTREDADKILRHTVGLLPDGELTGDFSGSMPRIEDFEPRSGPIGTRVEIIGTNFLPGIASDNMVLFGDVQAPILEISGTRILTEVPAGAITALIRVRTPGGTAISNGEFVVTYPVKGSVTLDGGLNPADFILTSGYDELDGIPINGQFEIQVPQGRVALLGAVSKGPSNNSYLSFLLPPKPGQEDPEAPPHINAYTTAKALVLMHPYFLTDDPAMVRYLHTLMDGLPEIIALAQAIAQHYPGGADGLNFPAVEAAWLQAVVALSNSLPASLLCAISPDGSLQPAKASKTDPVPGVPSRPLSKPDSEQVFHANPSANLASVPDTHIYGMDQDFVEANYDDKVHGVLPALFSIERPRWAIPINIITPERITYSPVDWVVALYRIDPVSMPRGINESFVNLRWRKLETTGYNVITTAPANLWTAKIDILYTLIDQAINSILETFYPSGNTLRFQDTNDGVYMLRAFSGAVYHPTQKDDFIGIDNIVNGRDMELTATAINIALAAVDQWDLCTGESKRWARAGMKKAIQNSVRKLSQEFVSVDRSRLTAYDCAAILGKTLVEAGKGFASALPQAGVTYAQEKMLATLESTATRLNTVLSALDKISSAGRVMERLIGLLGYMANPLAFELSEGPSPLESTIIVIGDPFSPKVTSIEPTEGGADAIVTLTGERFQPDVEDNYVYFQDQYENRTEIPVVAVRNRTQMDIRIPSNLTNNTIYRVYVRTSAGTNDVPAPRRFLYKRIPRLTGITPQTGFAPIADAANPVKSYSAYGGTKVTLQGYSFLPFLNDEVHFGDATASIDYDSITNTQIPVTVPALSPGTYPVYLLSPQNNNAETDRFDFTVLPAPVLTNIVPSSAKIGQRVTVFGQNFGNETQAILIQIGQPPEHSYVRADSVSGATAVFRMPTIGAPNESMPITVWTPSGQSESRTITRAAGIGEARTVNLPEGWSIQVNTEITGYLQDRHISLDEAAAFGRGELDPFSAGWDDTNIIVETHWYPRIDPTTGDITSWTEGATHQRTEPAGPGTESTFYYGLYHNTDGTITRVPGGAESRDNGPENMEEGDYITGVSRDRGGANFADTISVSSTFTRVLHTWNLTLGNDDDLYVEQVHLEADGMNLRHGSIVYAATITADARVSITISGDDNLLTASCIDFPSHAVLVQGGFRNTINVNIFDCQGTGITLRGGGGNEVQIYQIQRCAEYGIRVEQSELNTIYQRYHSYDSQELDGIVACDQGAVFLDRAHENTLTIQANANLGFGVGLSGSNLNKLNLEVRNTLGEALFLDNSCENELLSGDFIDNARGIALQGGSQSNTLTSAWILGTLNSGILIDGEGTSKNVLNHCDVSGDETGRTIGGNGILIQGGAHHNHIKNTSVTGCEENGVRITGIGTDSNVIEDSWLGWLGDAEQGIYDTNDGWGVQIADHAFQSDVKYCVFGGNMLGGISVLNVAPPAGMEEFYSFVLRYNSIGFTEVVVTLPGQSAFDPSDYYLNWTGGSGISLNQARGGLLLGNMIHAHNQGIRLENTTDNDIEEQRIDHSITDGICATASNSDYIEWPHIGYPAGNGIHLSGCDGTTLVAGYAQSASRNGVLIDSSTDILVHEMQIGPRNEMGGLSILFSQDITVENCNSVQNLKNGYDVVLDSSNVTFNCSHADSNGQNGYFIADSSNVRMFGERPREGLWVFNNGEAGIDVLNAQNIHIGYDGKGVNVSGYTTAGILIAGNETDSVQITSSIVPNNGQILGEYGIHVLGGKNITIGGPLEVQGNNIELWNQIGILVEGADTGVSITNNLIGEPEIWESGTRAYGNRIGIQLKNNVQKAFISRNIINANQDSGIVLSDGAHNNTILSNQITENGMHGILVQGPNTVGNVISQNVISRNEGKGIQLSDGGNHEIKSPVITGISWHEYNITGMCDDAPEGSIVEVYTDDDDEGYSFVGRSEVFGNNFYVSGEFSEDKNLHAVVIHPNGDTSEFGPCELQERRRGAGSFAFASMMGGTRDIFILASSLYPPIRLTTDPADDFDPQLSEDGRQILFVSDRSGNEDIWLYDSDTASAGQITDSSAADYDPSWLGGSDRLAFVSERDGNPEIYTMPVSGGAGGGNEISYFGEYYGGYSLSAQGNAFGVHFTADSGRLASISFYIAQNPVAFHWKVLTYNTQPTNTVLAEGDTTPTTTGWYTINTDNLSVPTDFTVCIYYLSPLWPALGTAADGVANRSWEYNQATDTWAETTRPFLIKVQMGVGGPVRLTNAPGVDRYPCWSPDKSRIAFVSDRGGNMDIWTMNADGSNPQRLTDGVGQNTKPAWSPDGQSIAFVSTRDGNEEIYICNLSSGQSTRVTASPMNDTDPAWNHSGNQLLFGSNRESGYEIFSLSLSSGDPTRLTVMAGDSTQPDAGPAGLPNEGQYQLLAASQSVFANPGHTIAAVGEIQVSLGTVDVKPGDAFTLPVHLGLADGLGNFAFDLAYDPTGLELLEVTSGTLPADALLAINPETYPSHLQPVRSNWVRATGLTGDSDLLSLRFQVSPQADKSEYKILFQNVAAYTVNSEPVSANIVDGVVRVDIGIVPVEMWMLY